MNFDYHEIGKKAMTVDMNGLEEMITSYTKVISILKDAKAYRNKIGEYSSKQQTARQNGSKNRGKNRSENSTKNIPDVESNIPVDISPQNPTKNSSDIQPKNTTSSRPISSSNASYPKIKPEIR